MSHNSFVLHLQQDLLLNILKHSEDIGKCAVHITTQVREIIGARIVALFERLPDGSDRLVDACPQRRKGLLEKEPLTDFVRLAGRVENPMLVQPGDGDLGRMLTELAMEASFIVPLRVGRESFGFLLIMDIMDNRGIHEILSALIEISGILSLILKNSFLFRNLKTLVEQRTAALRESEEQYRLIFDQQFQFMAILAPDGTVKNINTLPLVMQGAQREDYLGHPFWEVPAWRDLPEWRAIIRERVERAGTMDTVLLAEDVYQRADGSIAYADAAYKAIRGKDGTVSCILVQAVDITERKLAEEKREKLQAQLHQAQKLESIGRLAGGVAHDFNNMLGVILGHTEMAMEQMDPSQPLHTDLGEIHKAAGRSADLTRQLLAFARKQTAAPKVLDLNETVEGMLKMLRRLIGEDIALSWLPGKNLAEIKIDPSQVDQILANLCVNARDAIRDTGRITIETANIAFNEDQCADREGFSPGEYVLLAVSDDGCGMSREVLENIFEPFFTTKEVGKGTGLGLATVYGIVRQNDGFIHVYSEPEHGTTFRIYLPRHQSQKAHQPEQSREAWAAPATETATILLVEDEPSLLKMTAMMLETMGYTVLAAGTPRKAVRLAREHAGGIDLLMTDVVMPEMNGRDLARNLLSMYPTLKLLFMSGYTANVIAHHGVLDKDVHFIQKPFSMKDLGSKIKEALEQREGTGEEVSP